MDTSVIDAIKRWPDVPAAWGWLSLSCRGEWRLHPLGDAARGGAGESIRNTQIIGFINRNYVSDNQGRWLFQNGPQKVYVRLDSTPFILQLQRPQRADATDPNLNPSNQKSDTQTSSPFITHNRITISSIDAWYVDQDGHVYACTDKGIGRVDDRDLLGLTSLLKTPLGQSLDDLWPTLAHSVGLFETHHSLMLNDTVNPSLRQPRRLFIVDTVDTLAKQLGFIRNPTQDA